MRKQFPSDCRRSHSACAAHAHSFFLGSCDECACAVIYEHGRWNAPIIYGKSRWRRTDGEDRRRHHRRVAAHFPNNGGSAEELRFMECRLRDFFPRKCISNEEYTSNELNTLKLTLLSQIVASGQLCDRVYEVVQKATRSRAYRIIAHKCESVADIVRVRQDLHVDFVVFAFDGRINHLINEVIIERSLRVYSTIEGW